MVTLATAPDPEWTTTKPLALPFELRVRLDHLQSTSLGSTGKKGPLFSTFFRQVQLGLSLLQSTREQAAPPPPRRWR